ncbi:RNA-guided endonuclease InsQ/TnpB family protein [Dendronalium sp. ChiSLP03b]|uniref:RNA-guided endonuclease InsQ/TnpB family protein n=1 Tax=Dendronalium sp. ChiSLP03b TaxID=3075381 RepID=UPI003919C9AB
MQRQLSRRKKGSKRRQKSIKRVAKSHLKVANQRKDFHYKTAIWLLNQSQVIAHENLNIKGLAKSMLAKSVNDAGWGQFLQILNTLAASAGCLVLAVNPNGTSQECSDCGATVPKILSDRWHSCQCGASSEAKVYLIGDDFQEQIQFLSTLHSRFFAIMPICTVTN